MKLFERLNVFAHVCRASAKHKLCAARMDEAIADIRKLETIIRETMSLGDDHAVQCQYIEDTDLSKLVSFPERLREVLNDNVSDDSRPTPCEHEYGLPQHSGSVGSVWTCNKCEHRRFSEPVDSEHKPSRDYEALYNDLIYQVAKKHPGESRHYTAKRYIVERETPNPSACASAESGQTEGKK